ncbi:50S ribosomal protein L11 methyltransferase [Pajaroellobacter abortibovis]|uniref:Ribosomal protein L11 methyltransferase n=1 Tax=Pajaroellobacter abortibovis TaxID=1882918 RepID=A0A1L6MY50_9BACT|nr:50S ribosomal protein L11 methyltransferase [Pajaroellobacter abortibovis]APS00493.1 hypothetical protein BCY86_07245 [Pajaroellobacter abortibovis]
MQPFATEEEAENAVVHLPSSWSPHMNHIVGDSRRDEWKKYLRPFLLCSHVVVCPPWESYIPKPKETVIQLEPGRAFGTGLHESTQLAAAALLIHRSSFYSKETLDVGCGSGISGLTALALVASYAHGTDTDPDSVATAQENAERNGWHSKTKWMLADSNMELGLYDTVVANIEQLTLIELGLFLIRHLAPHGILILSGLLVLQAPSLIETYNSLLLLDTTIQGE